MKRLIPGILLFSLLGGTALAQNRVATVDVQKIFDKYWKTKQANAALKDRAKEFDKSDQKMIADWKQAKADYQKLLDDANNQAVSSEEREKRRKAAEDKLKDVKQQADSIDQFERQARATLAEQKVRMRKNLLDDIKLAIASQAKAGGYSLVIDSGAQTYVADPNGPYYTPTILYSHDSNDLTAAVIAQLNTGAPIGSPKAEEDSSPTKDNEKQPR